MRDDLVFIYDNKQISKSVDHRGHIPRQGESVTIKGIVYDVVEVEYHPDANEVVVVLG